MATGTSGGAQTGAPARALPPDLSVVLPFYNPGDRLRATVGQLLSELEKTGQRFEVIAVSDGTTDGSIRSVGDLRDEHFRLIELDRNYGKGEALRIGMKAATGRYVGFIDADGDIAPELMASFAEQAARDRPDALLGSKYHPESAVHSAPLRRLLSVVWQALVKLLFQFPVSDSQAGIKLFRRDVLERALPLTTLTGFAFDLELLVVARDLGYTDLVERPIQIAERSTSTVSLGTSWRMLTDLVVIFWRTRVRPKVRNRRSTSPDGAPRGSSRRDDDVGRPPADRHRPADVSAGEVNRDDGPAL